MLKNSKTTPCITQIFFHNFISQLSAWILHTKLTSVWEGIHTARPRHQCPEYTVGKWDPCADLAGSESKFIFRLNSPIVGFAARGVVCIFRGERSLPRDSTKNVRDLGDHSNRSGAAVFQPEVTLPGLHCAWKNSRPTQISIQILSRTRDMCRKLVRGSAAHLSANPTTQPSNEIDDDNYYDDDSDFLSIAYIWDKYESTWRGSNSLRSRNFYSETSFLTMI